MQEKGRVLSQLKRSQYQLVRLLGVLKVFFKVRDARTIAHKSTVSEAELLDIQVSILPQAVRARVYHAVDCNSSHNQTVERTRHGPTCSANSSDICRVIA